MVIRKATLFEVNKIVQHSLKVMDEATMGFVEANKEVAQNVMSQALMDGGYYLVFIEDEVMKGWIGVGRYYNSYGNRLDGMLLELYVLPQYRKQGIAERLVKHACEKLKSEGYKKVMLNVYSGNFAKRLYENLGFYDVSTLMEKEL